MRFFPTILMAGILVGTSIFSGCISTLNFSMIDIDTMTPEQKAIQVELVKAQNQTYQTTFIPGGGNSQSTAIIGEPPMVGGMLPSETYAAMLKSLLEAKGRFRLFAVDWILKSDDERQVYRKKTFSDNGTESTEETRSYGD